MKKVKKFKWIIVGLVIFTVSCKQNYVPKPTGYFRIDLPEQVKYDTIKNMPYSFEFNSFAKVVARQQTEDNAQWIDIIYPRINATIYISYKQVDDNLPELLEDAHKFVYKHSVKADAIEQQVFSFPERNVAGIFYDLDGNIASPIQFFSTDSSSHFLRGALYFDSRANQDSLMPLVQFVTKDIHHIIETLEWK